MFTVTASLQIDVPHYLSTIPDDRLAMAPLYAAVENAGLGIAVLARPTARAAITRTAWIDGALPVWMAVHAATA